MRRYDLSVPLDESLTPFPGDPPFLRTIVCDERGAGGALASAVSLSLHLGTHVDAPCHVLPGRGDVLSIELDRLAGPARHLRVTGVGPISRDEISARVAGAARVVFSGGRPLSRGAAESLAESSMLVGVDSSSVDPPGELAAHKVLLARDVVIVENLRLSYVPEGDGVIVCLPLPVRGGEGAPARVLFEM